MGQGDQADALYLVVSGRFAVEVDGRHVAEVGSGAPIGEVAFFADGRRTATVTALRDSLVLKLPHAEFLELTESNPAILKPIMVTLARRLADALAGEDQAGSPHPRTIAVINAGTWPVPEVFRRELTRALVRYGEVATIDANSVATAFPEDPMLESDGVTTWLNKQELRYHYVLYFADAELTPFSRKAIRQADQLILVGKHETGGARINALESFAFYIHSPAARRLVLLHDARGPVSGTARWLDQRPCTMHLRPPRPVH
jgi:NTE family protein